MSLALLQPPSASSPGTSVRHSSSATAFLKAQSTWSLPYPLSLLFDTESQAKWQSYENIMLACLRTGDFENAYRCLNELTARFGKTNERIMGLTGLYQEATAEGQKGLQDVLDSYDEVLKTDPAIFSIRKRRAALLRTMGKTSDAVAALVGILDASPTDSEAWAELGDVYFAQGSYEQSIHCWEEVLLVTPNAWNIHARLGEIMYIAAIRTEGNERMRLYVQSMRRYCRSIELCDDYLRGYYGLKLVTTKLMELIGHDRQLQANGAPASGVQAEPSLEKTAKLNEVATTKLAEIVRKATSGDKSWDGYNPAEIAAARQLLDKDTQHIQR